MLFTTKNMKKRLLLSLFLILGLTLFAACSSDSGSTSEEEEHASEHEEEGENAMEDLEHEHDEERIPNPDGAAITILSPADGATFAEGEEIIVEVQVDNFEVGVEGSHWHVYVDGASWGMVMGGNLSQSLNGVEPGEHLIATYLAGGDHIEFQDGASIHVTVEE